MAYTTLEIEVIFDRLWEMYPNKAKESSARKALTVALKTGEDHRDIEQAVRLYALETKGDDYHYHFSNFINEHHWKDMLDAHKNVDAYIQKLEEQEKTARRVIDKWNEVRRSHWCVVASPEKRVPIVLQALKDPDFQASWEIALEKASNVFRYKFREGDWRNGIVLSIRWFCNTSSDKHTVLRILEGEYGIEQKEEQVSKRGLERRELTKQEKEELIKDWNEVFNSDENDDAFELQ